MVVLTTSARAFVKVAAICILTAWVGAVANGQTEEYAGPSILSRGGTGMTPAGAIDFRAYFNLSATYQTGINVGAIGPDARLASRDAAGGEGAVGLYGYHHWKTTVLGINYRGDYRHYNIPSPYRGSNQFLMLGLTHRPTRKVAITVREGAGTFKQNQGYLGTFGFYDPTFAQIPHNELLDTRTDYFSTMLDLAYQCRPRLSFNFGGTGFLVRRRVSSFYGVTGTSARADAAYRLTRRSTLGADYFFTHFGFNKAFGSADMHSAGANYSIRLSRTWEVGARVGMLRLEMLSAGTVQVDPLIAAIIGRSTGFRASYTVRSDPTFWINVARVFPHSSAAISVQTGASPGNGVYLTSRQRTATASYSYTGMRHWSLQAHTYYSDMRSVGQDLGRYETVTGGWSAARRIKRHNMFLTVRCDIHRYLSGSAFRRYSHFASVGVAFSPGDKPLRLW